VADHLHPEPVALAAYADGVLHREQAGLFALTQSQVRAQLVGSRWRRWGAHVVILHNGPPTRRQFMWVALLDAGWPAALVAHTSLELAGFRSFATEQELIHLVMPRGARTTSYEWLRVHESRRVRPPEQVLIDGMPATPTAQSAIDAAAWQPYPRFAWALVAAVVQQRLVTPAELDEALRTVGRVRHKAVLRAAVADLRAGGTTTGEADVVRMCRRFGLQLPHRQVPRRDGAGGLRFLDAEWVLFGGERIVLEVDGSHHMEVAQWQADLRRERGIVVSGARVLRTSNMEIRLNPQAVAADLVAAGVPRVIGPTCQIPQAL
jgi:hypothetical protein